jgi:hypothetical protein
MYWKVAFNSKLNNKTIAISKKNISFYEKKIVISGRCILIIFNAIMLDV